MSGENAIGVADVPRVRPQPTGLGVSLRVWQLLWEPAVGHSLLTPPKVKCQGSQGEQVQVVHAWTEPENNVMIVISFTKDSS